MLRAEHDTISFMNELIRKIIQTVSAKMLLIMVLDISVI